MKIKARRTKEKYIYHKMVKLKNYKRKTLKMCKTHYYSSLLRAKLRTK